MLSFNSQFEEIRLFQFFYDSRSIESDESFIWIVDRLRKIRPDRMTDNFKGWQEHMKHYLPRHLSSDPSRRAEYYETFGHYYEHREVARYVLLPEVAPAPLSAEYLKKTVLPHRKDPTLRSYILKRAKAQLDSELPDLMIDEILKGTPTLSQDLEILVAATQQQHRSLSKLVPLLEGPHGKEITSALTSKLVPLLEGPHREEIASALAKIRPTSPEFTQALDSFHALTKNKDARLAAERLMHTTNAHDVTERAHFFIELERASGKKATEFTKALHDIALGEEDVPEVLRLLPKMKAENRLIALQALAEAQPKNFAVQTTLIDTLMKGNLETSRTAMQLLRPMPLDPELANRIIKNWTSMGERMQLHSMVILGKLADDSEEARYFLIQKFFSFQDFSIQFSN
jgi:hypothetical protein